MDQHRIEIAQKLPLDRRAPTAARRTMDLLADRAPPEVREMGRLVLSELVTNAVKHSGMQEGTPIEVRVMLDPRCIRIEVADRGPGFEPRVQIPSPDAEFGRGLFVVDRVADRWGTQPNGGIRVWAELDLPKPVVKAS